MSSENFSIDGYKGAENIRWYINELHRIRFMNHWLADCYCNKLREFYIAQFKSGGKSDRDAEMLAGNAIADLAAPTKKLLESYWRPGQEKPESIDFDKIHDGVTKRMLAALGVGAA